MKDNIIIKKIGKISKNTLSKAIFTFLCMFMTIYSVCAYPLYEPPIATGDPHTYEQARDKASKYSSFLSPNGDVYTKGIRISILNSNGNELFTEDYVQDITYGHGNMSGSRASIGYGINWADKSFTDISELQAKFSNIGLSTDIRSLLSIGHLGKADLFADLLRSKDNEKAKAFFSSFGINPDNHYNANNQSYDLFLVWEPLAAFYFNDNGTKYWYVGTAHELLNFMNEKGNLVKFAGEDLRYYSSKPDDTCIDSTLIIGEDKFGNIWKKNEMGEPCTDKFYTIDYIYRDAGFYDALISSMACSVVLTNSDEFGDRVGEKFGSFSSRSYFGGNLNASDAEEVSSNCDTGNSSPLRYKTRAESTTSLGIGILWFDDIANGVDEITCPIVEGFYGGKTNLQNYVISGIANFDLFNNQWLTTYGSYPADFPQGVTVNWYKTNCMTTPENPVIPTQPLKYNCTPKYSLSNCNYKGLLYQDVNELGNMDQKYWQNCIFNDSGRYDIGTHKTSKGSPSYYDSSLGSQYCEVYCIEGVYANYDYNNPTVLAGSNFTWGYNSAVMTTRICRTKSINWGQFTDDLKRANQAVLDSYAAYRLDQELDSGYWAYTYTDYECPVRLEDVPCNNGIDTCQECPVADEPVRDHCEWRGDISHTVNGNGMSGSASVNYTTDEAEPGECGSLPEPSINGNTNYGAAISHVNQVIAEMEKCYNFEDSNVLNDQSKATVVYNEDKYKYKDEMDKNTKVTYSPNEINCVLNSVPSLINCSGDSCYGNTPVKKCDEYNKTGNSTSTFSLKGGIFQYVLKNKNLSIHRWELENNNNSLFTTNYIDIGYSNFPVSFNSKVGTHENGLKIEYSNLGHYVSGKIETAVDSILKSIGTKQNINYGTWSCDYTVKSELIPDKDPSCEGEQCNPNPSCVGDNCNSSKAGDINVIYREIDLEQPFPDTNAKNRYTGANWCDNGDCKWNNSISTEVILKNRNSNGSEIYNKVPMYTFIMTPSDIIKIRRYNDKNKYTDYTGSYDEKNYDFKCEEGTGGKCISDYLTELMNMMKTSYNPGTCKDENARNTSQTSTFETCRYK